MNRASRIGVAEVGIGAVRVYQWTLRPMIGAHCRFWPSCSDYAVEALRTHGAARGTLLAALTRVSQEAVGAPARGLHEASG